MIFAREFDGLDAVARLDDAAAPQFQEIVEELHIQLVVFYDQNSLGHLQRSQVSARRLNSSIDERGLFATLTRRH